MILIIFDDAIFQDQLLFFSKIAIIKFDLSSEDTVKVWLTDTQSEKHAISRGEQGCKCES